MMSSEAGNRCITIGNRVRTRATRLAESGRLMRIDASFAPMVLPYALSLCLCVAISGSSGAPAEASIDADQPDGAQSRSTEPVDTASPESPHPQADVARFDLECTSVVRDVTESRGGPGEEPHAPPNNFNPRFFVDLAAQKYCSLLWCETSGIWRIHAIDANTVTFMDVRLPDFVSVETVDRRNGRYVHRSLVNGLDWLGEGTCRQEPFSGFPDTSNAIFGDPWGPNGERLGDLEPKPPPEATAQTH